MLSHNVAKMKGPPPIRKFSENSLNLVQVVTPQKAIWWAWWVCVGDG